MAMVLATQAQRQGAEITILLCGEAGRLALADAIAPTFKPIDRSPVDLLGGLIAKGAVVEVCALFLPQRDLTPDRLHDGISVAHPATAAARLLDASIKTLSF
jgi:predicted peroxiredoxin